MASEMYKTARVANDPDALELCFAHHLKYSLVKDRFTAKDRDRYLALALTVWDRLVERWIETQQAYHRNNVKRIYYLSLEYLMGRSLGNNLFNLKMEGLCDSMLKMIGIDMAELMEQEGDAGLGNGGLGRLAACFLDSMATMALPAIGYGLRYDYGIFRQEIRNGNQVEEPDEWLRYRNVWEIERPEFTFPVNFGGKVEEVKVGDKIHYEWVPAYAIIGVPHDTPVIGYGCDNVNTLRLWSAKASAEFDFGDFNQGDYIEAVRHKIQAENLTKVLYPNDTNHSGRELRFSQQYLFVSCSLQDIVRRFKVHNTDFTKFPEKVAIQLNDTHPAIAIAELLHILVDKQNLPWQTAWKITTETFGYTNHTLLPEALERWPVEFFQKLLPRHLQIIYLINQQFLGEISIRFHNDPEKMAGMSLVEEGPHKQIRMAHLATVGSHSINGVSELHTELLKKNLLRDFYEVFPQRFNNKTNGITPRRWLLKANPPLAKWITERIGDGWIRDLPQLKQLEKYAQDPAAQESFGQIKLSNKKALARLIDKELGIRVDPEALFDVHIKRIHEYKRQTLNLLHIVMLYIRLKANPLMDVVPRVFVFGGKAAPGYFMAKQIIKQINSIGGVINNDKSIQNKLKVVFIPNYGVSVAEKIIPAAEVSEQISTAGMEASGTGNMKLALNGALTVGTLDGANVEIAEEVGKDNLFIFGLTADEIHQMRTQKSYDPWQYYKSDSEINTALDLIFSNRFCTSDPGLFDPLKKALLDYGDTYFVLADLRAYANCQALVSQVYRDQNDWNAKAILTVARMGKFSSDRVIHQYAQEIWHAKPQAVDLSHKHSDTRMQARMTRNSD